MASSSYAAGVTAGQVGVGNIGGTSFLAIIGFWQAQFVVGLKEDRTGPKTLGLETGLGTVGPNPTPGRTRIRYTLASPARVSLRLYDPTGRVVQTLRDADMVPGRYEAVWDGTDHQGRTVAGGVYFCRFVTGDLLESCKLVVQR
ncbi:MAG: T9SS type A sorting domain-containing protein [candidate division WOR-3 bacterium]|nr:MAG: T9SS type A sorting domain-containing protein [candidate division WOR-3 bacterium]